MAGLSRPASAMMGKKHPMRAPTTRPSTARAHSAMPPSRSGAASPADSSLSTKSSPSKMGIKRKLRDEDVAGDETNINVVVRCRGRSEREVKENSGVVLSTDGVRGKNVELSMGPSALSNKTYHFDKVFSPAGDQSMIFDDVVTPILDEMLQGFNCTIFAYGQTGTGKTYTMSGDMSDTLGLVSDSAGIIPRVLHSMFRKLDADDGESSVKCSFIELYNEELRDLLSTDDAAKLKIYEDGQKKGHSATMVQGMEEAYIKTAGHGLKLLQDGSHKRQVAATKCNDLSSRSHTVFTITAYIKRTSESGEDFVSAGKLNLVDLAGSENIQRSGAENKRAAEAGLINKSLLTLGRVINALVERSSHIPYRESKLTRLLQDSLGGRTKTCIIATVSPAKSNLEETISTLDYAFRAKNIRNKPQINAMISKKTLLKEFTSEIEKLKSELVATRQRNGVYLSAETYDEMLGESESRRILCDEQQQRIDTMETSLRNKVQELFALTNNFTTLKKDNDTNKQILDQTKGVLERTELVLADTRQTLMEEKILRKAHQATELQLKTIGTDLISTLDKTTSDVNGLHSKNKRKSDLHMLNKEGWQRSQGEIASVTQLVESRLGDFQRQQDTLVAALSARMQTFVQEEMQKLSGTQDMLKDKVLSFEQSEKEVVQQTSNAKEDMNIVLEEIKVLREDVKRKVGEGLNGLSAAAGRIAAEVINELGLFHTQLHTSYSSLGKEFKNIFEDLVKHVNSQKAEAERFSSELATATTSAVRSEEEISTWLEACLQEERTQAQQERQVLLSQITNLVNQSAETQDARWSTQVNSIKQDLTKSRSSLEQSTARHQTSLKDWADKETVLVEDVLKSRETLKLKIKEDWRSINDHNNSIHATTKSVHEETIRIVDAQMKDMNTQMQALDDFVTRARTQNERHHQTHLSSLQGLASNIHKSYSSLGDESVATYDRVRHIGSDISDRSDALRATLSPLNSDLKEPLVGLRSTITAAPLQDYVATGETPQKTTYMYPTALPETQPQHKLLGHPDAMSSPSKSPTKALIYTDSPPSSDVRPSSSPTKNTTDHSISLREISQNVTSVGLHRLHSDSAALPTVGAGVREKAGFDGSVSVNSMPPLKRQATESKLPMKLRGGGLLGKGEKENQTIALGASVGRELGRRLRSREAEA